MRLNLHQHVLACVLVAAACLISGCSTPPPEAQILDRPIASIQTEDEMRAAMQELMYTYGPEATWTREHEAALVRMEELNMHRRIPMFLLPAIKAGTFPKERATGLYQHYRTLDDDPEWQDVFQTAILRLNAYP